MSLNQPIFSLLISFRSCGSPTWISDHFISKKPTDALFLHSLANVCTSSSTSEVLEPNGSPRRTRLKIYHPKTRLDHPEIPQNSKSSELCSLSSSAQCSVEIPSSLSGVAILEVCSWGASGSRGASKCAP